VDGQHQITDGMRTMNIVHVEDLDHSADMLVVYLPQERLLIEADLFSPHPPAAPTQGELALYHTIKRGNMNVERIVPLHGAPVPMADFLRIVAPQQAAAQ
jgi:hypothetical protein